MFYDTAAFIDDSKAKVIPLRSEQGGFDGTNEFSPEIHRPEANFKIKVGNEEIGKCNADGSASATS